MKDFCIYSNYLFKIFYYKYCALSLPEDDDENKNIVKNTIKNIIER